MISLTCGVWKDDTNEFTKPRQRHRLWKQTYGCTLFECTPRHCVWELQSWNWMEDIGIQPGVWMKEYSDGIRLWATVHSLRKWHVREWKLLSCVRLFATPWTFLGQNTGVGSLSLLQGIFPTQGLNPGFPHCRQTLYCLNYLKFLQLDFKSSWVKLM